MLIHMLAENSITVSAVSSSVLTFYLEVTLNFQKSWKNSTMKSCVFYPDSLINKKLLHLFNSSVEIYKYFSEPFESELR